METLAPHGFQFFLYAPKGDAFLRRQWRDAHSDELWQALADFGRFCKVRGVRFGIGLSPYNASEAFHGETRRAFDAKVKMLNDMGIDDLAILFDDMRGDVPELAVRQAEIVHCAAAASATASRIMMCPTYYSDDRILDRAFGQRPDGYLNALGARLDRSVDVFWTGEEVCAREYSIGHISRIAQELQRPPMLWDNYPVNDGQRMSRFIHLRSFTGRPATLAGHISAHAINPALQPTLSCIPALTLAVSYRDGASYAYMQAFRAAAQSIAGHDVADLLEDDMQLLQETGLDRLGILKDELRRRWSGVQHPIGAEIVAWLDGGYSIEANEVQTQ